MIHLKKMFFIMIGSLLLSGLAQAQGKIAVLDLQQAILATEAAKKQVEELRKTDDYKANKAEADKLRKEYDTVVENFAKNREVMSAEQQAEQRKKMSTLQADFEHVAKKLQQSELELVQKVLQEQAPKAQQVVSELIKVEGIGLLLDAKAAIHAELGYSINAKVTDKLNQVQ